MNRVLGTSAPLLLVLLLGLFSSHCEKEVKNSRASVPKDYGTFADIIRYNSVRLPTRGMDPAAIKSLLAELQTTIKPKENSGTGSSLALATKSEALTSIYRLKSEHVGNLNLVIIRLRYLTYFYTI